MVRHDLNACVRPVLRVAMAAASLLLAAGSSVAQETGPEAGQIEFNNHCRTCHTVEKGDNRLGPSLHGIIGREAGALPDYDYSDAMRSSSVVWDEASLDAFIANPDEVVRGHNMKPFSGIADPQIRAAIVDYLAAPAP